MARGKRAFLVQGPGGLIKTVQAETHLGAIRAYGRRYGVAGGELLAVKERGAGDWRYYEAE